MASQTLPKTIPNPLKIPEKTSSKNERVFKAIFKRIFRNFDLKIHRFFDDFFNVFSIELEKRYFVKIELSPRREHDFLDFECLKKMLT